MFDWAWSYFTYNRSARLITGESNIVPMNALEHMEEASQHVAQMEATEELSVNGNERHPLTTGTAEEVAAPGKRTA